MIKVESLEDRKAEIAALRAEARTYGVYLATTKIAEIRKTVAELRNARAGMPPCYWRSFDGRARECRICEVRNDCARGEPVADHVPTEELRPVSCHQCGTGSLDVEIADPETKLVLEYGCSTPDCPNVLSAQAQFIPDKTKIKVATPPDPKATLPDDIVCYVEKNPGARIPEIVKEVAVKVSAHAKREAVKKLVADGRLQRVRVQRGFALFLPDDSSDD